MIWQFRSWPQRHLSFVRIGSLHCVGEIFELLPMQRAEFSFHAVFDALGCFGMIDFFPCFKQVFAGHRKGRQSNVSRSLLTEQSVSGKERLGRGLIIWPLRSQAFAKPSLALV